MRKVFIKILAPFIQGLAKAYFSRPRTYRYKTISGTVLPGVFYPHYTISTRFLMEYIEAKDLENKSFLELGCGTGLISVLAAKKGAKVLASDINPKALENTQLNAERNEVKLDTLLSDLFDTIPTQQFDWIVINPPYYQNNPQNMAERAWYCGNNFEYFEKLFSTLSTYTSASTTTCMILSEDCAIKVIKEMGLKQGIHFEILSEKKQWGERSFIFRLKSI